MGLFDMFNRKAKHETGAKLPYPSKVKADSERAILAAGGKICDWLPVLDQTEVRSRDAIVHRALVLNALLQIHFRAPTDLVRDWIDRQGIAGELSETEKRILGTATEELDEQTKINLYWYIESLWALLWVGQVIDEMPFDRGVEDFMASRCPDLSTGEDGAKFTGGMAIRSNDEMFRMLDLYYRCHWYARNCQLTGADPGAFSIDIIMERRKALEWVMDRTIDWDDVRLDT